MSKLILTRREYTIDRKLLDSIVFVLDRNIVEYDRHGMLHENPEVVDVLQKLENTIQKQGGFK
jgi:hypothetical protein